jgi:hypothetical protein
MRIISPISLSAFTQTNLKTNSFTLLKISFLDKMFSALGTSNLGCTKQYLRWLFDISKIILILVWSSNLL